MIEGEKLKDLCLAVSGKYGFRPALVEKDYYLTVILKNIGRVLGGTCVFKGGTLLNKAYLGYHRLSEDLDFSYLNYERCTTRTGRSRAMSLIRTSINNFIAEFGMKMEIPEGRGFNNSTQYVFSVVYDSKFLNKPEKIKIEISLRAPVYDTPVFVDVKHFFKDVFTGRDVIEGGKVLSLTLAEAAAEKLKAAITRKIPAIRDFYDLKYIKKSGFDFNDDKFVSLFKKKMNDENVKSDFKVDFGFDKDKVNLLKKQVETDLKPVIRPDEGFNLDDVFEVFNKVLAADKFKL